MTRCKGYHLKKLKSNPKKPMQEIHTDIMGPIKPVSDLRRYLITYTNDFSRYTGVHPTKRKSHAGGCLEDFLKRGRSLAGHDVRVCFIRADCANKNLGGNFNKATEVQKIIPDVIHTTAQRNS